MEPRAVLEPPHVVANGAQALCELGVTDDTLTTAEKDFLQTHGYLLLRDMLDPDGMKAVAALYEELMQQKYGPWHPEVGNGRGNNVWYNEPGTRRLTEIVSDGPAFDRLYVHPRLLAAVAYMLGSEFQLASLNARDALPGQGDQELHTDGPPLKPGEKSYVTNSMWLLDAYTLENGATRVVPGSHTKPGAITDYMKDPRATHPDEVIVTAPAGSVVVFSGHTWHGGTRNRTDTRRRVIHSCFSIRSFFHVNQKERIRKATYERISPAARYILQV